MFSKEVWDSQLMWDYVWQIVPALILPQKLHVGIWHCLGLGLLAKFSSTTHMNTLSRLNQTCLEAQSRINFLWCWDRTLEPWIQIPWGFLIFFCLRASYRHKFCITLLSNRLNETFERKNQTFQWDTSGPWAELWGCYLWNLSLAGYSQEIVLRGIKKYNYLKQELNNLPVWELKVLKIKS